MEKQRLAPGSRRLITTPRQRLAWLVGFANLDLTTLSRGDHFNVREQLRDLLLPLRSSLAPGGLHLWPPDRPDSPHGPPPESYPQDLLVAVQAELYEELELALINRQDPTTLSHKKLPSLEYEVPHVETRSGMPHRHFMSVKGTVRDLVLLLFYHLMASQDTAQLARCTECERVVLRQPNQRYCGKACANRAAQRRWRARQAAASGDVVH